MNLEVGMYVRIINDIRAICIGIGKIETMNQETIYVDMGKNLPMSFNINQIAKASHNILELIKPLDLLFIDIDPYDGYGGIVVPRIAETLNELNKYKELIKSGQWKLVSVITYEQIERNCYKVSR